VPRPGESRSYKLLAPLPEAPAWDVVAQRGDAMLVDARDSQVRSDLLCALLLALFPAGTGH
jgi:hypothetical protein